MVKDQWSQQVTAIAYEWVIDDDGGQRWRNKADTYGWNTIDLAIQFAIEFGVPQPVTRMQGQIIRSSLARIDWIEIADRILSSEDDNELLV